MAKRFYDSLYKNPRKVSFHMAEHESPEDLDERLSRLAELLVKEVAGIVPDAALTDIRTGVMTPDTLELIFTFHRA